MGFLTGSNKTVDTTPQDVRGIRGAVGNQLQQGLNGNALAQAVQGGLGPLQGITNAPQAQDMTFFYNNLLKPYQDLFAAQRGQGLAQAKESAGNLTGSGYNNILGESLAGSLANEQGTLAQTLLGLRSQEIGRNEAQLNRGEAEKQGILNFLLNYSTHPAGQRQNVHSPGLIESLAPFGGNLLGTWLANRNNNQFSGGGTVDTNSPFYIPGGVGGPSGFGGSGPSYGGPGFYGGQRY